MSLPSENVRGQRLHERYQLPGGAASELLGVAVPVGGQPDVDAPEIAGDEPRELVRARGQRAVRRGRPPGLVRAGERPRLLRRHVREQQA